MGNGTRRHEGRVVDESKPGMIDGRLIGFAINSAVLHLKHCSWLDKHVVPILAGGGSVSLLGLTSRSGSAAYNLALSKRRASAVLAYLRRSVRRHVTYKMGSGYEVKQAAAGGEGMAEFEGQKDGTEDPYWRQVWVLAWPSPTPPPLRSTSKPRRR
jgi:hypothetical protein